jgi:hypothetical protein
MTRHRAVIVLGNSDASVDTLGAKLLEPRAPVATLGASTPVPALEALACVLAVLGVLMAARSRRRIFGVAAAVAAQAGLVVAVAYLPWQNLAGWSWALASGSVFAATILGVDHGFRTPRRLLLPVAAGLLAAASFYGLTVWLAG